MDILLLAKIPEIVKFDVTTIRKMPKRGRPFMNFNFFWETLLTIWADFGLFWG